MANWFCRVGTVTTLRPIIKCAGVEAPTRCAALRRDAAARAGAAAALRSPHLPVNKSYRSMPGLILIEGYKDHASPRVIFPSFLIPFKFNMKDSQVTPTQEETRFPCF